MDGLRMVMTTWLGPWLARRLSASLLLLVCGPTFLRRRPLLWILMGRWTERGNNSKTLRLVGETLMVRDESKF